MNRTILIVICDFLLVSLLAFSTVDINKAANPTGARTMADNTAPSTNQVGGRQDLGDVMRLALEEEKKQQTALADELSKTRAAANQQQALLNQRNDQLLAYQQQLRAHEEQSARLQQQQTNLLQQMTLAQGNIEKLNRDLQSASTEILSTKEQRAKQEAETRKEQEQAAALRNQLASLERSNQLVSAQREQLASQLQLTEAQKQAAAAQLARTEEDLTVQREQNAKLSEGVKVLAGKSSELAREIRENRPLAPNTIFDQVAGNRVMAGFFGVKPGIFGDSTKSKQTQTIVVTDGTNTFALCHLQDTLLSPWDPAVHWEELTCTLSRASAVDSIDALSFYQTDPRIALMPLSADAVRDLGCKVFHLASDPYKFQDAVVIGAREGYYGECQFQIDLSAPQYLKMDHNTLKGLFGKFNPSTGDLVFSRTGDLLGVMANNTYCIVIKDFQSAATVRLGTDTRAQPIAETLSSLYATVTSLPFKLQ